MKVRCIQLLDALNRPQEQSAWLTLGKVYHVLSVVQDINGQWLLRLISDMEPRVGLFRLQQFDVLSAKLPSSWIATWNAQGVFELTPEAWNASDYWERFFDHDASAEALFEIEKAKIIADDP